MLLQGSLQCAHTYANKLDYMTSSLSVLISSQEATELSERCTVPTAKCFSKASHG